MYTQTMNNQDHVLYWYMLLLLMMFVTTLSLAVLIEHTAKQREFCSFDPVHLPQGLTTNQTKYAVPYADIHYIQIITDDSLVMNHHNYWHVYTVGPNLCSL